MAEKNEETPENIQEEVETAAAEDAAAGEAARRGAPTRRAAEAG